MTLPPFAGGWTPRQAQPGGRFILELSDPSPLRDRRIDALCRSWHRNTVFTAYLETRAPFMENLSMLENFWLPQAWKRACTLRRIYEQAQPYLPCLGWSEREFERLMLCRPGDLPPAVLGRAQLLRATINRPDWLLMDANWFERPLMPLDQAMGLVNELLPESRWLVFGPLSSAPLHGGCIWSKIQLATNCSLGRS